MSVRLFRHVVVTLGVLATVSGAAWALSLPGNEGRSDARPATTHEQTQRIVDDLERAVHADRAGYRFVAASSSAVTTAERNADLIAAVDAAIPADTPRTVWDRLADCESGDWRDGVPQLGTARWDYGLSFSHGDIFEGGVNFHPRTWDSYKDPGMPAHAGQATRSQQIEIAERVLADQGWRAWPVCSRKLGLR